MITSGRSLARRSHWAGVSEFSYRRLKKSVEIASKTHSVKPKSKKRKEAGKIKAASLKLYHEDFRAARKALKDEGYKGSLKMKRGMPMYAKVEELRKVRATRASSSFGSAGSAVPGSVGVTGNPIKEAPTDAGVRAHVAACFY